ncbi:hypothetical protein CJ030_MR3G009524 [Morella rubra]|uniref:Uncharacterized protein n=1 Tax=Morella rubra TaxID=262757 RepID=A0A6A1W3T4_9ROSI|nr:hypothetical protein CJ030_MR3G009524 [Morella rubra]
MENHTIKTIKKKILVKKRKYPQPKPRHVWATRSMPVGCYQYPGAVKKPKLEKENEEESDPEEGSDVEEIETKTNPEVKKDMAKNKLA